MQIVSFKTDTNMSYGAREGNDDVEYTFCPLGPCIATDIDPDAVAVETFVNGGLRPSSSTKELLVPADEIVARIARMMTLLPGDVVATGTPAGAGPPEPGDRVEVRIGGIGSLKNTVVKL